MFRLIILSAIFLTTISFVNPIQDPEFHRVEALAGDNIYTFLQRYYLHENDCNFKQFYRLNKLTKTSRLIQGKKYYIPVLIYQYDNKSIRSTIGIKDWEQAIRIKNYNERMLEDKQRKMTLTSSRILWVPYHELNCLNGKTNPTLTNTPNKSDKQSSKIVEDIIVFEEEKLDPAVVKEINKKAGNRKFPIFGEKYAHVPLKSEKLRGKVYYIVAGHGGPDPGAVGKKGNHDLCEDEYAYDISLRLVRRLLEHGAIAYMITRDPNDGLRDGQLLKCDTDEYCWGNFKIPRNQKRRLFQRSNAINKLYERHRKQGLKEQTVVTIHIDSRNVKEKVDVFFYHFPNSKTGLALANKVHKTFIKNYKKYQKNRQYNGTVTGRDLHMLREPKPTGVFIELGNIRNKNDQKRFLHKENREALAKWLCEGLTGIQ